MRISRSLGKLLIPELLTLEGHRPKKLVFEGGLVIFGWDPRCFGC